MGVSPLKEICPCWKRGAGVSPGPGGQVSAALAVRDAPTVVPPRGAICARRAMNVMSWRGVSTAILVAGMAARAAVGMRRCRECHRGTTSTCGGDN